MAARASPQRRAGTMPWQAPERPKEAAAKWRVMSRSHVIGLIMVSMSAYARYRRASRRNRGRESRRRRAVGGA